MSRTDAEPVIGSSGVVSMSVASVIAAASGYLVLVLVARVIPPAANAEFLVFWSLLFASLGVLGGLQQEATRAVGTAELSVRCKPRGRARVFPWSMVIGAALAVVVAVASPWWRPTLLSNESGSGAALVLCAGALLYGGHLTLVGVLAGRRQWSVSALLIGGESLLRLAAVGVAATVGAGLYGLEVAVVSSTVFWIGMLLVSRTLRCATTARADVPPARLAARAAQAMLAAVGSAALIVGFPTLLRLSSTSDEWAAAAPLVLGISLTRAPLLIPLNAFQGVAIRYFLDPHHDRGAALRRVLLVLCGAGVVAASLALVVGPPLMVAFFGPQYRVGGPLLGALVLASTVLAALVVCGSGVLALGRHGAYVTGWLAATAIVVAILFLPLDIEARAVFSLVAGPALGTAVFVAALRRSGRSLVSSGE